MKANGPGMSFVGPQPILVAKGRHCSPEMFESLPPHCVLTLWLWNREGFEKAFDLEEGTDIGYPAIQPMPDEPDCSLIAYYVEDELKVAKLRYVPVPGKKPLRFIPD